MLINSTVLTTYRTASTHCVSVQDNLRGRSANAEAFYNMHKYIIKYVHTCIYIQPSLVRSDMGTNACLVTR